MAGRRPTVVGGVQRDVAELKKRDPALAKSGLAAAALELAAQMDSKESSASAKASCARALVLAMEKLRIASTWRQADEGGDLVDDLASRRAARRSA